MNEYTVKLKTITDEFKLEPLYLSSDFESIELSVADVNRPALQLTGFYDYFDPRRIQIIGMVETTYLASLTPEARAEAFYVFFETKISALVICHGCQVFPECIEMAKKHDRSVFYTEENTSTFEAKILDSLHRHMAPRQTIHGVLVEIYGEGVLLLGDSGIGKSETALELIKRGHRLIADDAVEIRNINNGQLIGTAPASIRYFMELRGIGVINVRRIYGVGAVKPETEINLVIQMERWVEGKFYDRLGLTNEIENILGIEVPKVTSPVMPGRNLAVILELAAMNNRQKKLGYNSAESFVKQIDAAVDAAALGE